ncbi:STAS domain-containing protein, partial [Bacillus licheniformis]|uniref:STAS domain-containing protein n=1 Tax=Bacillus licheniformis TaxID=1402 RepID=UPI003BFA78E2
MVTVSATGELDILTARDLREALRDAVRNSEGPVVVDLSGAESIDSTNLANLINTLR